MLVSRKSFSSKLNDSVENFPLNLVSSPDFASDNILSEVNPFYATDLICH